MNKKHFGEKSFTLFTINFIIGLGFLTTIANVWNLGFYGYLIILISVLTIFGTSLVFSRLANSFKEHYGGSYAFSRQLENDIYKKENNIEITIPKKQKLLNHFNFFIGWNQFIQSPVLSSISPLFLSTIIELVISKDNPNYSTIVWIIRIISFIFFALLIAISTFGLKLNTKIVFLTGIIKWIFLGIGLIILIYLTFMDNALTNTYLEGYKENINNTINIRITPKLIFTNIILFIFSFAGIEDMASMTKDVKFKNFRKVLFWSISIVLIIYLLFYTFIMGIKDLSSYSNFSSFYTSYTRGLGIFGVILFIVGFISNDIGYKISQTVSTARKLIPLSQDNHISPFFAKQNKKGEFHNAIIFTGIFTFISMVILWLLPILLTDENSENPYFNAVIIVNSIALLIEDMLTYIVAFMLDRKKIIPKIPFWEKIIYTINVIWIFIITSIIIFPFIINDSWKSENTFVFVIYFSFILIGFLFKWTWSVYNKKISQKNNKKFKSL
ncbi:APC family permease [Mycoplasma sp. CSL10137]|uniref:amino acid permease n=1 Tax=Mycoplasma sp. CSL10137 TaxID=2813824 RepID=UPI00197C29F5|nr:APC family permease [Mycoplasma sp. CSL10137]MBN4083222.1 APC family permease [Mycoplasma sp. CSL10137]